MKINREQASNIIRSLNDLIYDEIYIFDHQGDLVGSNQTELDDKILALGKTVAAKRTIHVADTDDLSNKVILLPVLIGGSLSAIVGLIGDYLAITQYSDLVAKIVEILLSESMYYTRRITKAENNRRFVSALFNEEQMPEALEDTEQLVKKKVADVRYLVLADTQDLSDQSVVNDFVIDSIERMISSENLVSEYHGQIILLFFHEDVQRIEQQLNDVKNYVSEKYKGKITFAISDLVTGRDQFSRAYHQVHETLKLAKNKYGQGIFSFKDLSMQLIYRGIDAKLADSFQQEVFAGMKEEEIEEMDALIRVYIENNTSLTKTSEALFIHKNTLQYRLNKVAQVTGYNPRKAEDLFKVFTALNLWKTESQN